VNLVLGVLVVAAVLFVLLPAVFASSIAAVYTGSMAPEMRVGALAVMRSVDPAEIAVGDVIAYNPPWDEPDVVVSHRVIEVDRGEELRFRTQGDANEDPDLDYVPANHVVGRVEFSIPNLGFVLSRVASHARSPLGFILLVGVPTVLLIGSAVRDMFFVSSPVRRRVARRARLLERRKKRKSLWRLAIS